MQNISFTDEGLKFIPGNFYLDPRKPVQHAIITHAHNDHVTKGTENIFCTPATADLIMHRYKSAFKSKIELHHYHESFFVNGIKITLISSGHMLGAAQVLIEYNGKKYLYTGDFKLQPDDTCPPYEFVKADVLITEATFANPETKHPDTFSEISKLNAYTNHNIVLGSYVLGKAQRISQLLATHCEEKIILTHHDITGFHRMYQRHGVQLDNWIPYSRRIFKQTKNCVYIVPPVTYKYYYRQPHILKAFASGWKHLQKGSDIQLLISDHADWDDLLKVIDYTQPSQIITLHGDGRPLQNHYKNAGIEFIVLDDY